MTITKEMIHTAYKHAKNCYHGLYSRDHATLAIHKESGMCMGSAQDYITIFHCLVEGKVYKRSMSIYSHRYFLERIRDDFGDAVFRRALTAAKQHTEYYASLGRGRLPGVERLIQELT